MRRVVIVASASGSGKTTLGRELAARLAVPFVELDALVHRAGRAETPDEERGRDALLPFALRNYPRRRRLCPVQLAGFPLVHLRSTDDAARFLAEAT